MTGFGRLLGVMFVALTLCIWYPTVHAGELSLQGRVVDQAGSPVGQVPVIVQGTGGQGVAITNDSGDFAFYNLPSGRYNVGPANSPSGGKPVIIGEERKGLVPWRRSPQPPVEVGEIRIPSMEPRM